MDPSEEEQKELPTKWWLSWWEDGELHHQGVMCEDYEAVEIYAAEYLQDLGPDFEGWEARPATIH